jgi:hypothetical protein
MFVVKSNVCLIVCLLFVNVGLIATPMPTVTISKPANNNIFTDKNVTVSGSAAGSNHSWLDDSYDDFNAGIQDNVTILQPYDNFNDNSIDTAKWTVTSNNGIAVTESGGRLVVSGTGTGSGYYSSNARAVSKTNVKGTVSADLNHLAWTGTGWVAGLGLIQDANNQVYLGSEVEPSVGTDPVDFFTVVDAGVQEITVLGDTTSGSHHLAVEYDSNNAYFYIDGALVGTKAISLVNPSMLVATSVRATGDMVVSSWDNVSLDSDQGITLDPVYDNFDTNIVSSSLWTIAAVNGISASASNGQLVTSGTATGAPLYSSRVRVESTTTVTATASAELTHLSYAAGGFVSGVGLWQDANNFVLIGSEKDASLGPDPQNYITTVIGGSQQITVLGKTQPGVHMFGLNYTSSSITLYMDGLLAGTRSLSLSNPRLFIAMTAEYQGDIVQARWDNVTLDRPVAGNFISQVYDTGSQGQALKNIRWTATVPSGSGLSVQVRASDSQTMSSATPWTAVTNNQTSGLPAIKQFVQYRLAFTDDNAQDLPVFLNMTMVFYKPVSKVEVSIDGQQTWTNATGTASWTIALEFPENTTTIWVRATDVMGDTNLTSIRIDVDTAPPTGSFNINDGAAFTIDREVTLTFEAVDHYGVASMIFSELEDFSDVSWVDYADNDTFSLSTGDGVKTIYVKFQDNNGHESEVYSATILLDTLPPTGSVDIDGGAIYTRNTTVTLTINATDPIGVQSMMVSNTSSMTGAQWVNFARTIQLNIPSGNGARSAYVKFRDVGGHVSAAFSDSITQDQEAPAVSVVINGGVAYTRAVNVTVDLTATENILVNTMQVGPGDGTAIAGLPWVPFQAQINLTLSQGEGTKTISARLQDAAGNIGSANSSSIVLDSTAPKTTMGPLVASCPRVAFPVTWSATDATSGVQWYDVQVKSGNGAWKDLLIHTNQTSISFTGEDLATYSFRARAQDCAGNLEDYSATVDNSLTVNLPEPIVSLVNVKENAQFTGKSTVTGSCQVVPDGRNVTKVEWRVDNGTWAAAVGTLNWSIGIDTTKLNDGKHTLQVRTTDGNNNSTVVERHFSVKNTKAAGSTPAGGALLLLGCIAIGLALNTRRRK